LYVEDVTCMAFVCVRGISGSFLFREIHLTAEARRWETCGRSDFVFRDKQICCRCCFLWLMLSSMAFEGTFVWVLPINVVLIALVVSMSFGLLLKTYTIHGLAYGQCSY